MTNTTFLFCFVFERLGKKFSTKCSHFILIRLSETEIKVFSGKGRYKNTLGSTVKQKGSTRAKLYRSWFTSMETLKCSKRSTHPETVVFTPRLCLNPGTA